LHDWLDADVAWHGPQPFNALIGAELYLQQFWRPFVTAFPDVERRDDIVMAGVFRDAEWLASTGHFVATFASDWLGIRATRGAVTVRYGEFCKFANNRVSEVFIILDWLDLMRQSGQWPKVLPHSRGASDRIPGPATRDGCGLEGASPAESRRSLQLVEAMIDGLMRYDRKSLASMGMRSFWHPHMMWYGPAGIGTARGVDGFEQCHQIPFLTAFPDRVGGDHKCRIGEAAYVASTGWPSVRATHLGDGWLGVRATNKRITMRVMDFWRREGDMLAENWVFIDMPDLLGQMGVHVLPSAA
jgi:predicted ester cyclase